MNNYNSTYFGSFFELHAALKSAKGDEVEKILDGSAEAERLSEVIRHAICSYVKELPGVSHTENSLIWAVPVIFQRGMNRFINTDGELVEVIDASTRLRMRKYFGVDYSVTTLGSVVPLNVLGSMPISEYAHLFGVLAGDATRVGVKPVMSAGAGVMEQLASSNEPELAFMLGSMTRVNRMPVINGKTSEDVSALGSELLGRMSLHLNKFPETGELSCGAPAAFPEAYEEGIKSLINSLFCRYTLGKPTVTCTNANDFIIRMTIVEHEKASVREFHLKRSILGMEGIKRLYEHAESKSVSLPNSIRYLGLKSRTTH